MRVGTTRSDKGDKEPRFFSNLTKRGRQLMWVLVASGTATFCAAWFLAIFKPEIDGAIATMTAITIFLPAFVAGIWMIVLSDNHDLKETRYR